MHVSDVATAAIRATLVEDPAALDFDCGSAQPRRLRDVMDCVQAAWEGRAEEPPVTQGLAADLSPPSERLGWSPRISLSNGISELIEKP